MRPWTTCWSRGRPLGRRLPPLPLRGKARHDKDKRPCHELHDPAGDADPSSDFFLPFHRVLRALRVLLLRASRALAARGKRKSATVPCPCMIHLLLFLMKKSTSTPSSPLSLSATILSAPTQPNVLCVPACLPSLSSSSSLSLLRSLSHVLVKKRQFDCTASPPLISSASPPRPRTAQPNKPDRIERIHSRERLLPLRARSHLSLSRLELLSNNPRSVGLFQLFQIAKQPRAYLTLL